MANFLSNLFDSLTGGSSKEKNRSTSNPLNMPSNSSYKASNQKLKKMVEQEVGRRLSDSNSKKNKKAPLFGTYNHDGYSNVSDQHNKIKKDKHASVAKKETEDAL